MPFWWKYVVGWFRVGIFVFDTGSDLLLAVNYFKQCFYYFGSLTLGCFLAPGFLSGGFYSLRFGGRTGLNNGYCGRIILIILGTIFGPVIFLSIGLYLLVKAAINPDENVNVKSAKE